MGNQHKDAVNSHTAPLHKHLRLVEQHFASASNHLGVALTQETKEKEATKDADSTEMTYHSGAFNQQLLRVEKCRASTPDHLLGPVGKAREDSETMASS